MSNNCHFQDAPKWGYVIKLHCKHFSLNNAYTVSLLSLCEELFFQIICCGKINGVNLALSVSRTDKL